MRIMIFFATVVSIFLAVPAVVQGRELGRNHSIQIEVECILAASDIIAGLNGYNADSFVFLAEGARHANFTRRVDEWAFRHVQEVLRNLGDVQFESEHSQYHGAEILNLDVRIAVLSQEMERLTLMMAASTSLDVLIAVNDRLARVSRDRDGLIGRRNFLRATAASPIIHITLIEPPDEPHEPDEPPGFGERVSRAFSNSWEQTRIFGQNALVFFARISLPLIIWAVVLGIAALIARKVVRTAHSDNRGRTNKAERSLEAGDDSSESEKGKVGDDLQTEEVKNEDE